MKQEGPYQHATFSVVTHPANHQLDETLNAFKKLVDHHPGFSVFTSKHVMQAADALQDDALNHWTAWYRSLYGLEMES